MRTRGQKGLNRHTLPCVRATKLERTRWFLLFLACNTEMINTVNKISKDHICKIRFDPAKVHFILVGHDSSDGSVKVWADIKQVTWPPAPFMSCNAPCRDAEHDRKQRPRNLS